MGKSAVLGEISSYSSDIESLPHNHKGIGVLITVLFIVGDMAGGGLVAMPGAVYNAGWYAGVVIMLNGAVASGYTGIQLGRCWTMLQELYPQYKDKCRKPYAAIGFRGLGTIAKHIVSFCIIVNQFGVTVSYQILAGQQVQTIINAYDHYLSFCFIMLIVFGILLPILMFGTPSDFWLISVVSMGTSFVACILMMVGAGIDLTRGVENHTEYYNETLTTEIPTDIPVSIQHKFVNFVHLCLAYGSISFAYGGHSGFPTIQHDMKEPRDFGKAVVLAYIIILCLYLPVGVLGYDAYGSLLSKPNVNGNVTNAFTVPWIRIAVSLLIGIHVMFSIIIVMNPLSQEVEEILGIKNKFSLQRILVRTTTYVLAVFLAESVPQFGHILSLIGASCITCLTFIFPGLFYLGLKYHGRKMIRNGDVWTAAAVSAISSGIGIEPDYRIPYDGGPALQNGIKLKHMTANGLGIKTVDDHSLYSGAMGIQNGIKLRPMPAKSREVPIVSEDYDAKWHEYLFTSIIVTLGGLAGIAGTYSAIHSLVHSAQMTPPCYLRNRTMINFMTT